MTIFWQLLGVLTAITWSGGLLLICFDPYDYPESWTEVAISNGFRAGLIRAWHGIETPGDYDRRRWKLMVERFTKRSEFFAGDLDQLQKATKRARP